MKPSEKSSIPNRSTFEIKHYIIRDEVQKGESGSPIHISTDEQISRHFGKASIQDERVCILKLELVETTSLLEKEDMTPRLGGSTENIIEDIHLQRLKNSPAWTDFSCSVSGLRFLTDNDFPLWLTWEMVQIADVP
jgi:hypothetical protein